MNIEKIIENRSHAVGETWRILEVDGTFKVRTGRLGNHNFTDRQEMESFIRDNHKGAPKGRFGIIHRKVVN